MLVKRYVVEDMPEALNKIRIELGKDAIILSSKRIRATGIKGWLGQKKMEVIAALNDTPKVSKEKKINQIVSTMGESSQEKPSMLYSREQVFKKNAETNLDVKLDFDLPIVNNKEIRDENIREAPKAVICAI